MLDLDISRVERIRQKWTGLGPWFWDTYNGIFMDSDPDQMLAWIEDIPNHLPGEPHGDELQTDLARRHAEAIADAPQDILVLLDEIDRLRRQLADGSDI